MQKIRQNIINNLNGTGERTASNLGAAEILLALAKTPCHRVFLNETLIPAWNASKQRTPVHPCPHGKTLAIAAGSALAQPDRVICILEDDEHTGQTWDAAHFAAEHNLKNLTAIVNKTNLHAHGFSTDTLRDKYRAFGWNVVEADGHDTKQMITALKEAHEAGKPTLIIAHTTPGKGVSFMENETRWHRKTPTKEHKRIALTELQ